MNASLTKWLLIGLAVFAGYALLPYAGSMVGGMVDEVVSLAISLAPRVAMGAALVAVFCMVLPFTRQHAGGLIKGALYVAIGSIAITVGVPWIEAHTGVLTTDVLGAGDTLMSHVTNTIQNAGG